jgi:hypothetical protein
METQESGNGSPEDIPNWSEVVSHCTASLGMKVMYFHEPHVVEKMFPDYFGKGRPGVRLKDGKGNAVMAAYGDCTVR